MKKIAISLIALAAVSTVALASDRNYDLRDSDTYTGRYAVQNNGNGSDGYALAVPGSSGPLTLDELIIRNQEKNASSSR